MHEDYWWRKTLTDGSFEFGRDSDIQQKLASWTLGRQDIISALVYQDRKGVELVCNPVSGEVAKWKQLDNFCFSASVGESVLLSRELWCTVNGYTRLSITNDMANIYGITRFRLNNEQGEQVPDGTSWLVCRIGIDGKVEHRWS